MAFVLLLAYSAVRLAIMGVSLGNTYSSLKAIESTGSNSSLSATVKHLDDAVSASAAAAAGADDPIIQAWQVLPIFGQDLRAIATLSRDGHKVLQAAQETFGFASQAIQPSKQLTASPTLVAALRDSVQALNSSVQLANDDISVIDAKALHFGLDSKLVKAQSTLSKVATALRVATPMVQIGAELVVAKGEQHWFIATQNLAEARAQGGIIGAFAVITIKQGKIHIDRVGSDQELLKMGPINFASYPEDLRDLWGVNLADWRDLNASANAPFAGQLIHDGWLEKTGQKLDGVLFVGQGTVAHIAAAGGPISVSGNALDSSNIVDFLTKGIYAKYPDVATKNTVVSLVMQKVFANLTKNKPNTNALFKSLSGEKTGDRLVAWSSHADVQKRLVAEGVAGVVNQQMGSNIQVTLNNAGGNKLDAYSHVAIDYKQLSCGATTSQGFLARNSVITVSVKNAAPKSGLPVYVTPRLDDNYSGEARVVGSNRELVTIYGPIGSDDNGFYIDGKQDFATTGVDSGHPVWIFDLELLPGQSRTIKVKLIEPVTDTNLVALKGAPTVVSPIMLNPAKVTSTAGPTCSAH